MHFATRAAVGLLAGIGAGTVGFLMVWEGIRRVGQTNPAIGHDAGLLGGIFGPGVLTAVLVFRAISRARTPETRPTQPSLPSGGL